MGTPIDQAARADDVEIGPGSSEKALPPAGPEDHGPEAENMDVDPAADSEMDVDAVPPSRKQRGAGDAEESDATESESELPPKSSTPGKSSFVNHPTVITDV